MYLKDGSSVRVLLVERNAAIHQMFTELFATLRCKVFAVSNCTDALTVSPKLKPHIVFSSLIFDDMSGLDLCGRLRIIAELDKTIFVALTGYSDANIRQKVHEAGFHHDLLKPVNFSSLLKPFQGIPSLEASKLFAAKYAFAQKPR